MTHQELRDAQEHQDFCLAFDITGPMRRTHNLCAKRKGHQGLHGNEFFEWPAPSPQEDK